MASPTQNSMREKLPKVPCLPRPGSLYGPLLEIMAELQQPGILLVVYRQAGQPVSWRKSMRAALRKFAPVPPKNLRWRSISGPGDSHYVFLDSPMVGRPSDWAGGGSEYRNEGL